MKTILKPLPKEIKINGPNKGPFGMQVCLATAGEKAIGAIYSCRNSYGKWYEAVPYDHPNIKRFCDPHTAQLHIELVFGL